MRSFIICLPITLISIFTVIGQNADTVEVDLSSPYQTITTQFRYLQPENFHPEIAALTVNPRVLSGDDAEDLVIKIKQIFDGDGIYIDPEEIPTQKDFRDTTLALKNKSRYVLNARYPEIYLERVGLNWYYSGKTCRMVPDIHKTIYPFGTDRLLNILPKIGNTKYFGFYAWQLLGILILVFVSFFIYKVFSYLIRNILIKVLARYGYKDVADNFLFPVARPFSMFLVILFLLVFVPIIQLPVTTGKYIILAIRAALPLFLTLVFYRLVDLLNLYLEKLAEKTETTLDDQLVPLVKKALKTFVVIIGGLFILSNLQVPIIPLLTGLSIGGLAFALAAQDTIKNFFGSLMIFVDKPFQIGDWITSSDLDGTVEEVGFRSTRIRTFRNSVTSVPNGKLADFTIDNHGLRVYRRFYTNLAITYDTPPDLIEVFIEGLKQIVKDHPNTRKDFYEVNLNDFGDSALIVMFYIFFQVPAWSDELKCRHDVMLSIIKLAEKLNVRFAFPTRTLHMENFPEKGSLTPAYTETPAEMRAKMESFLKK